MNKGKINSILKVILYIAVFAGGFLSVSTVPEVIDFVREYGSYETKNFIIGETDIVVKISDTKEKRIQGLSGVLKLSPREGMLFIFDTPGRHGIWMKDMKISIDIIWINTFNEVIHFEESVTPGTYPRIFRPDGDAVLVLEVVSGFVKKENIKAGDVVEVL